MHSHIKKQEAHSHLNILLSTVTFMHFQSFKMKENLVFVIVVLYFYRSGLKYLIYAKISSIFVFYFV